MSRTENHPIPHPTKPPPKPPGLGTVLEYNIRALQERRAREEAKGTFQDRLASTITRFTGSMGFVYLHVVAFGAWIGINLGLIPGVPQFDASFVMLGMVASVEAIFLSSVYIDQTKSNECGRR